MARAAIALTALLACCLPACFTPPALIEVRGLTRAQALAEYPPGTTAIEIAVDGGALQGLFVPAGDVAPIVVHLLGSGGSIASPFETPAGAAFELAGLGFASLLFDYEGVGASPGDRDVDHLARDARACWDAALERAGGDASRVHVRATSIGTLATASLLASGVRPASLVLIAPVTPASALPRGAASLYGDPLGVLAELLYRPIQDVALTDVLPRAPATLVIAPDHDDFLWDRERAALRIATERGGGTWSYVQGDHLGITALATHLLPGEESWWIEHADPARRAADLAVVLETLAESDRARFDTDAAARTRLEALAGFHRTRSAKNVAACALAIEDPALSLLTLSIDTGQYAEFDLADTAACFSDAAPIRPITAIELAYFSPLFRGMSRGGATFDLPGATWWSYGQALVEGRPMSFSIRLRGPVGGTLEATITPAPQGASAEKIENHDDVRRATQILLRAAGRPHRARLDAQGAWHLELWRAGAWTEVGPVADG